MQIETYAFMMSYFYLGMFFFSGLLGVIALWKKVKKKSFRHGWVIPWMIGYFLIAMYHVFIPYMAYDDPSDPNYKWYEGWGLRDFVFHDLKLLVTGLLVGALLCFIRKRRACGRQSKWDAGQR